MDPYVLGVCSLLEAQDDLETGVAWVGCRGRDRKIRHFVLVDEDHREWAESLRWNLNNDGYVYRKRKDHEPKPRTSIAMHREIAETADTAWHTDHINHRKWDNRAANLRRCTVAQNRQNTGLKSDAKSSRLRGVSLYKQGGYTYWRARGTIEGREYSIGYFESEEEANAAVVAWRAEHMPFSDEARAA